MATVEEYPGIRFPDRAEALSEFSGYKIFLEPWEPLAVDLRTFYEGLALRRESRALAIHSPQGTGKTLFAQKLQEDFVRSRDGSLDPDPHNLWHRITGGAELTPELIQRATALSDILLLENNTDWVNETANWLAARSDRRCVVIADNAERPYFRQGLVSMTDTEYVGLANDPQLTALAAQRFVEYCRSTLRGALFILLSNDDVFLLALDEAVEAQHQGLLKLTQLPLPDARTKETVVRVNTNRLNPVSYWFCIDKAGPNEKSQVRRTLEGASNFPDSFIAVDTAVRSRTGRPARKNVITLVVLSPHEGPPPVDLARYGELQRTEVEADWFQLHTFSEGWAPPALGVREASFLESEWTFRLALVGKPFVESLIEIAEETLATAEHQAACEGFFDVLKVFHGPGTRPQTRTGYAERFRSAIEVWPESTVDVTAFWDQGMTRSRAYEKALRAVLPGYDEGSEGFLSYRPDYVVSAFRPCSVVGAVSDDSQAITAAIRRDAHVFEFTAFNEYSDDRVVSYMTQKLPNYVDLTQEQ